MKIETINYKQGKPRVGFCHGCGSKLRGNHFAEVKFLGIDHLFIYHKSCAEIL